MHFKLLLEEFIYTLLKLNVVFFHLLLPTQQPLFHRANANLIHTYFFLQLAYFA